MNDAMRVVKAFSIASRALRDECAGVVLHQLRKHPHHFGAVVVDEEKVFFVGPLKREEAEAFIYNAAAGLYHELGRKAAA